jgi:predicted nucleic acid-binding protein
MAVITLDASAAIRMVLSPADHEELLNAVESASEVMAPQLFCAETGNALWKYCRAGLLDADVLGERHAEAMSLVSLWIPDKGLFPEALALAVRRGHSVYDCLYLVMARRFDAVLLTADKKLKALDKQIR